MFCALVSFEKDNSEAQSSGWHLTAGRWNFNNKIPPRLVISPWKFDGIAPSEMVAPSGYAGGMIIPKGGYLQGCLWYPCPISKNTFSLCRVHATHFILAKFCFLPECSSQWWHLNLPFYQKSPSHRKSLLITLTCVSLLKGNKKKRGGVVKVMGRGSLFIVKAIHPSGDMWQC